MYKQKLIFCRSFSRETSKLSDPVHINTDNGGLSAGDNRVRGRGEASSSASGSGSGPDSPKSKSDGVPKSVERSRRRLREKYKLDSGGYEVSRARDEGKFQYSVTSDDQTVSRIRKAPAALEDDNSSEDFFGIEAYQRLGSADDSSVPEPKTKTHYKFLNKKRSKHEEKVVLTRFGYMRVDSGQYEKFITDQPDSSAKHMTVVPERTLDQQAAACKQEPNAQNKPAGKSDRFQAEPEALMETEQLYSLSNGGMVDKKNTKLSSLSEGNSTAQHEQHQPGTLRNVANKEPPCPGQSSQQPNYFDEQYFHELDCHRTAVTDSAATHAVYCKSDRSSSSVDEAKHNFFDEHYFPDSFSSGHSKLEEPDSARSFAAAGEGNTTSESDVHNCFDSVKATEEQKFVKPQRAASLEIKKNVTAEQVPETKQETEVPNLFDGYYFPEVMGTGCGDTSKDKAIGRGRTSGSGSPSSLTSGSPFGAGEQLHAFVNEQPKESTEPTIARSKVGTEDSRVKLPEESLSRTRKPSPSLIVATEQGTNATDNVACGGLTRNDLQSETRAKPNTKEPQTAYDMVMKLRKEKRDGRKQTFSEAEQGSFPML